MASDLRREDPEFPEVSYVVTQTGRNDDGTDPWTMSHIEVPVGLTPYDSWPGGESAAVRGQTGGGARARSAGLRVGISQPIIDGVTI